MKNSFGRWFKELRPAASALGFLVAMASAAIAFKKIDWITLVSSLECFTFLCATMANNNHYDMYHDRLKGEKYTFAYDNREKYGWFVLGCWSIEAIMISCLLLIDWRFAAFALPRAITGFSYSWTRKVPILSAIMVAVISALFTVTPALRTKTNYAMWMYLTSTGLALFGREMLKDLEDRIADTADQWKKTIAVIWGEDVAKSVARATLVFSALVLLSMPITGLPVPSAIAAAICIYMITASAFIVRSNIGKAKLLLDLGIAAFLLTLNASYWLLFYLQPLRSLEKLSPAITIILITAPSMFLLNGKKHLRAINQLVQANVDDGNEGIDHLKQSKLVWPLMYGLYWIVVFTCRIVYGFQTGSINPTAVVSEALIATTFLTLWLVLLILSDVPHVTVPRRTKGYTVVERMLLGLVVGFLFAFMSLAQIPLWLIAMAIPLTAIISPELESLEDLLKSHGCVQGIVAGSAIVKGIGPAIVNIAPAYLLVVLFYYCWHLQKKLKEKVYIPKGVPLITDLMTKIYHGG